MSNSTTLPAIATLKAQAKRMRQKLCSDGQIISHSQSLEIIARQLGYKDWNTLFAAPGNDQPVCPFTLGQRVNGEYLGQSFAGQILGLTQLQSQGRYRVTVDFDEPVDVVTFDSFSAFRKRVSATIDADGVSPQKTSNGKAQMQFRG